MAIAFFYPASGTDSNHLGLLRLFRGTPRDKLLQDDGADGEQPDISPVVELHPNLVGLPTDRMDDVATRAPRIRRGKGMQCVSPTVYRTL